MGWLPGRCSSSPVPPDHSAPARPSLPYPVPLPSCRPLNNGTRRTASPPLSPMGAQAFVDVSPPRSPVPSLSHLRR